MSIYVDDSKFTSVYVWICVCVCEITNVIIKKEFFITSLVLRVGIELYLPY